MIKAEQTIKNSLYGDKTYQGYKTCEESPFVVFKGVSGVWTIGHERSQLLVGSLIPTAWPRTRAGLLDLIARIEAGLPEVVKVVARVEAVGVSPEQSEALRALRPFAMELVP